MAVVTDLIEEMRQVRRLPPPSIARAIRREAGVSQQRVATELGVHRVTIARWELGTRTPRNALRHAYANLLADIQAALAAAAVDQSWPGRVR